MIVVQGAISDHTTNLDECMCVCLRGRTIGKEALHCFLFLFVFFLGGGEVEIPMCSFETLCARTLYVMLAFRCDFISNTYNNMILVVYIHSH